MILTLKTAPAAEPVSLTEVKAHCRIDSATEDTYLGSLIKAARQHMESLCGPLITQTWYQYEDDWPDGDVLSLGKPRLQSVTAITYTDEDAVTATLASSTYTVDTASEYVPRVVLDADETWPSTDLHPKNPIRIEFICGYGDASTAVPEPIRIAMLMLISHWYEQREPVVVGQMVTAVPMTVDALLANYRCWGF